ncbi:PKD domain-containing protein, partial [Algoriphagus antarcticus]
SVTAEDGSTQDWVVTLTFGAEPLSTEKAILTYEITGANPAIIDAGAFTVGVEVPFGTDITGLAPIFTLSEGATASPASGVAANFTSPVTYSVTAEDGSTQDWEVTLTVADEVITPYEARINFQDNVTIPPTGYEIDFGQAFGTKTLAVGGDTYAYGWKLRSSNNPFDASHLATGNNNGVGRNRLAGGYGSASDIEKLEGTLVHFQGDNIRNNNGTSGWPNQPRANELVWEIEIPNGIYEVTLSLGDQGNDVDSRHSATVEGFTVVPAFVPTPSENRNGTIVVQVNDGLLTITGEGGYNSKINYITILPSIGTPVSGELVFDPLTIDTTLSPNQTSSFTATLQGAGAGDIGLVIDDVINGVDKNDTDFNDWLALPASGSLGSIVFANSATGFTVGTTRTNKIIATATGFKPASLAANLEVIEPASTEKAILTYGITGANLAIIDAGAFTVGVEVPSGMDITGLAPTFTLSEGATASPASGVAANFTSPVTYTVTAEDGSTQDWVVTVTIAEETASTEKTILTFNFAGALGAPVIDTGAFTVGVEVPFGTDVTGLAPTFTLSEGATSSPVSGVAADFTSPVTYTVTAEDGSTQDWVVTVTSGQAPVLPCSPYSLLPCDQIVKSSPINLTFDGNGTGLVDKNGVATGFTVAVPHSAARLTNDLPITYPEVNGFEPSKLTISGGNLVVTATHGIAFLAPPASSNNNTQVNSLGVGLNNITGKLTIETKLLALNSGGNAAQAGIWFGLDEDNFVKLNYNNGNQIELRKEVAGLSSTAAVASNLDQIQINIGTGTTRDITLRMEVDPVGMTIRSFYSIGTGEFIQLTNSSLSQLSLPQVYLDGLTSGDLSGNTFAGVFATYRNGSVFDATFDYFSVNEEEIVVPKTLQFSQSELNFTGEVGSAISAQFVDLIASEGTPTVGLSDDPDSGVWLILPTDPTVGNLEFGVNTNSAAGTYSTTVFATDEPDTQGYENAQITINLTLTDPGTPTTDLKVNFSDPITPAPAGYIRDSGDSYANRGNGYSYGWLDATSSNPADLTKNGRNRAVAGVSTLDNTLIHMQYGNVSTNAANGYLPDAKWEIEVPNGTYTVLVAVGDPNVDGSAADTPFHTIEVEGTAVIDRYEATGIVGSATRGTTGTVTVIVTDGKLTLDPGNGFNTKIRYVEISSGGTVEPQIPRVLGVNPANGATNVPVATSVSANNLFLPNAGGLNNSTINASTVKLTKQGSSTPVTAGVNGTGGGDAINLTPNQPLEANTTYVFTIDGVQDVSGAMLEVFTSTFTTDDGGVVGPTTDLDNVSFTKVGQVKAGGKYTSLEVGPDGLLYALEIGGDIHRWTMNADGTLANEEVLTAWKSGYGSRTAIGFVFDPAATSGNLIAYISHVSGGLSNGPDWDGKISKLTGPQLATEQLLVTDLPRSKRDHLTNSLAFRSFEPTVLYFNQGSNSAAGAFDNAWQKEERMLSGATLRLDLAKLPASLPLNVRTTDNIQAIIAANVNSPTLDGLYNPYYVNAPLTLFASGVRNAYDLVWHSNGQLYIPANGTAGGSNAPASIDGMRRPNGTFYNTSGDPTNYPAIPASINNNTQRDWLFRVNPSEPIGYYGHPNPLRGEFVLNRGDVDVNNSTNAYNGVVPDINYRGAAFDFELNKSPNGVIEYQSNAENGNLRGAILVVRYSGSSDIIALVPDGPNGDIQTFKEGIPGFTGFGDPLDLVEDVSTGNIYVADYARNEIVLLRPSNQASPKPVISANTEQVVGDAIAAGNVVYVEEILLSNLGNAVLNNIAFTVTGGDAAQFTVTGMPSTLNAQNTGSFQVTFDPASNGPKFATLTITGNNAQPISIGLSGLGKQGLGGANEPSLQWILDTHLGQGAINVGDSDPSNNIITTGASTNYNALIGGELAIQKFQRASDGPVSVELLSVYGPTGSNPVVAFGWYLSGNAASVQEIFTVTNDPLSNGQSLNPIVTGVLELDPANASFGFVSRWPFFQNRQLFSEDVLNTFTGAIPHHVRVYALPGEDNAYIVATEEHISGFDYQDIVVIVRNVMPFSDVTPEEGCSPISTLDCQDIDVTLPFTLNFTGSEGGLANTGFTMVDNPSARIAIDGPVFNANVPGFEPSRLSFFNGNLVINANNGIAFANNTTSSDTNSQLNTLGAGFDADAYGNFSINTTLAEQYSDAVNNSEQGGLWFGLNEDNFVKLIVDNGGRVELRREVLGVSANSDQVITAAIANINSSVVKLRLYVDLDNSLLQAFYTINTGAEIELGTLPLPASYITGNSAYSNQSFAGVFATKRRELTAPTVAYAFADFSIVPDNNPVTPTFGPLKINFSTAADAAPVGYERDLGTGFGDRGNGFTYGWLTTNGVTPLDLTGNTRNRAIAGADFIQNTIIHMQYANGVAPGGTVNGNTTEGIWEVVVPNGTYAVTIGVGDLSVDGNPATVPSHTINIEGVNAVNAFVPTGTAGQLTRVTSGTATVTVTDGRLTIDAAGGFNTKIHSLEISQSGAVDLPFFTGVNPANNATGVAIEGFQINVAIDTPAGYELNLASIDGKVKLFEVTTSGNIDLPINPNDTGGGDAITVTPIASLKENTQYIFQISGVQANRTGDLNDLLTFVSFESRFTTGDLNEGETPVRDLTGVSFTKVAGGSALGEGTINERFSSLAVGPDGKLYGSTIGDFQSDGKIFRWDMAADGTLENLQILSPVLNGSNHPVTGTPAGNDRLIIGFAFDPNATAENLVAYITHSVASESAGPEWDGKLTKLSGPNLATVEDLIIHLPRSSKDHLTNSLTFDPAGLMFITQGSNSAGGNPDPSWNNRPERLLSAAILKIDLAKLPSSLPLSAFTTDDISVINAAPTSGLSMSNGTYNPYSASSPLTIFASGIRNAYDLVWHSNGWLYVPTNGTAGNNNNSPNSPATTDYPLARRIDGLTTIPATPSLLGGETQKDWLFKTRGGSYHGHPNPYRGEFILNHGGLPYSNVPGQTDSPRVDVNKYPRNLGPDPNYRQPAYDFGFNKSPNGVIEYKSDAFGGKLQGLLMVVRFSGQDDIIVMDPASNGDIAEAYTSIPGMGGFDDPLDLVEDPKTGNIYISEYDRGAGNNVRLTLLRASVPATLKPELESNPEELLFEIEVQQKTVGGTTYGNQTDTRTVEVTNNGTESITISSASIEGDILDQFNEVSPAGSTTLTPGQSLVYTVTFAPALNSSNLGYHTANLVLTTNSEIQPEFVIGLHALKKNGLEGGNEPPLQAVVNTLGFGINVGWTQLAVGIGTDLKGEEELVQQWVKAGPGNINITPVGRYSPAELLPFGWYTNTNGVINLNEVGALAEDLENAQTLYPEIASGNNFFDPSGAIFGLYVDSNTFNRTNYTEDGINTGGVARRARTYPMRDRAGNLIENSFLVAFEDASNGDYQDYMFVIDNVIPYEEGLLTMNFNPTSLNINTSALDGNTVAQQVTLDATGPLTGAEVTLVANAPWINLPANITIGVPFDLIIDKAGLSFGTYQGKVTATAPGYPAEELNVQVTITAEPVYTYQFNFQSNTAPYVAIASPSGWTDDFGAAFGQRGGFTFGWVTPGTTTPASAAANGRNRNTGINDDALLKTFTIMGHRTAASFPLRDWLIELPNGSYTINISVGDGDFADSYHKLNVNGVTVIDYNQGVNPLPGTNQEATATVEVTNGIMRLSLASGGVNAKPNYIRIAPFVVSAQAPLLTTSLEGLESTSGVYRGGVTATIVAVDRSESAEGIVRTEYSLNGSALQAYTAPVSITAPGNYTLLVEIEDGNGNVTTETYTFAVEALSGALLEIENMTKIPGTQRAFPANDYYTFYRFRTPGEAVTHDANVMKLKNTGTGDLVIDEINLSTANDYTFTVLPSGILPTGLPLTIPAGGSRDININFISNPAGGNNAIIKRTITISSNADNGIEAVATLHGGFAPQPEGGDEIDAQEVFDSFGFTTSMRSSINDAGNNTGNFIVRPSSNAPIPANVDAGYEGDLILSANFVQANPSQPVRGLQLSALHGGPGSNGAQLVQPLAQGNAVVGGMNFSHGPNWYQTLLPKSGGIESTIINADFANTIAGPFRIAIAGYSSAGGNNINAGSPNLAGLRIYKAIDRDGKVIPNEYIALQDFVQGGCGAGSANCDWNDNTFYFINIRPEAVPTAEALENLSIIEGVQFTTDLAGFYDKGYPGNKLFFSLQMVSGDAVPSWLTISENGQITGTAPANAESSYAVNVIATDYNGLIAGSPLTILVDKAPVAIAEANVSEGRAPLTVSFTGENSTDEAELASYEWFFETGATATTANAEHIFASEGEYEVILTVTDINGLTDSDTLMITALNPVGPLARATSDIVGGQAPITVSFDGSTSDSDVAITDYLWDFGTNDATANTATASYTYTEAGEYTVTLTVTDANSLTDQTSITITVTGNVGPTAIAAADVLEGDAPLTVSFLGSESTDDLAIVSYLWNFGNEETSTLADPTVTFNEVGVYPVTLTVTDAAGLTDVANLSITVNEPAPEPNFELRINAGGPELTHEGKVFAADNSFVGGKVYANNAALVPALYKTERSANPPTFSYQIPVPNGTYTLNLHFAEIYHGAAGGGAGGNGKRIFDVNAEGVLILDNFDMNAQAGPQTVIVRTFEVTVTDGVMNLNFSALAAVGGVNEPKVSAIEIIGFVNTNQAPVAVATATPESGFAPLEVVFSGVGSTDDESIATYTWNFGDGSVASNEQNPTHVYAEVGEFTATLTVTDEEGLTNSATVAILVTVGNQAPVAVATATPESGFAPLEVVFSGVGSTDDQLIATYTWNFGDGSAASNEQNPTHVYAEVGEYTATLTVADGQGLTNSATVLITVAEEPTDNGFSLYLNTGSAANVAFDGKLFVGDLATPTLYNSTHTYTNTNASNLPLYQTERGSQADLTILNYSIPVPNGTYTVSTYHNEMYFGKVAGQVNAIGKRVFDILIEGNLVKDNLDLFSESGGNPIKLTFTEVVVLDGVMNISMPPSANRASISGLAIDKVIDVVVENEAPVAAFTQSPETGITTETTVSFNSSSSTDDKAITSYGWDFGDGTSSTEANPTHTFTTAGTYSVSLTVTDAEGLSDVATIQIEVFEPAPVEYDFSMYINAGSIQTVSYEGKEFVG